jgi:hypothetical protein
LSRFGIHETTGTSGGDGQEVRASRKIPQAMAAFRADPVEIDGFKFQVSGFRIQDSGFYV